MVRKRWREAMTRLRLRGVERRPRFKSRRQTFGGELKIMRLANFDAAFGSQLIGMTVGIDGNSSETLRGCQLFHAGRQASTVFSEAGYCRLQMVDVFFHAERTQMVNRILLDQFVLRVLVACQPQASSRFIIAGMRCHLRR